MSTTTIVLILILLAIASIGFYYVFKNDSVDSSDFLPQWRTILMSEVDFYDHLIPKEKERFEVDILKFFDRVRVTGVNVDIDDLDRLLVACSAVIPLFGYPGSTFDNISEVLIYEGTFNLDYETKGRKRNILGMVGDGVMNNQRTGSRRQN